MPSPLLTITIERFEGGPDEHHIHAGGQGFWVARMIRRLGVDVSLAAPFGGDTGAMLRYLIEREGVAVQGVDVRAENGSYIHDRRDGDRVAISEIPSGRLSRHELDDFYDAAIAQALDSAVLVLTGPSTEGIVPNSVYGRIARDARKNGVKVVADMSGGSLEAALEGGVDLVKVSHEQLLKMGIIRESSKDDLVDAVHELHDAGAENIAVSHAEEPAIALLDGELWEISGPRFDPLDHRGAGDSMTAGISVGMARGESLVEALRLGVSAGALNVTRHGLGTGSQEHIQRLSRHVKFRRIEDIPARTVPVSA